jgi:cobyrinic acid a,c-diamide synthase
MHAFVVGGTHSGVGKTSVSMCIASALKKRGYKVQPFKVGPDFIDPSHYSFCEWAVNLDAFMMGENGVKRSFYKWMSDRDVGIIEGVMGLFDGLKLSDFSSTAHIAKLLDLPVILVIDVKGMSLSALAMFEGYKKFDRQLNVIGVIFNGGTAFHEKLKRVFSSKGYEVLGVLPRKEELKIDSRHLGLHLGMESKKDYKAMAEIGEKHLNIDRILELSMRDNVGDYVGEHIGDYKESCECGNGKGDKKIGVPFDEAFSFYYRDNLRVLRQFGDIVFFSPLKKEIVECDFYYLGGGYPELYNLDSFSRFIKKEALSEKPIYGECGGMMLLSRKLEINGRHQKMAGVLDIDIVFTRKLQALSYINGKIIDKNPFFNGKYRAHEFHYSYAVPDDDVKFVFKTDGKGIRNGYDGALVYNTLAGYSHIHFFSTSFRLF